MSQKNTTALFLDNIPPTVKSKFKSTCVLKGKTMRNVILEFMKKFSEQKEK